MNNQLIAQLNIHTQDKYDYLRLKAIDVKLKSQTAIFNFVYPADKESETLSGCGELQKALKSILNDTRLSIEINLIRNYFDKDFFVSELKAALKKHPFVYSVIDFDKITVDVGKDNITVCIMSPKTMCEYIDKSVINDINIYVKANYTDNIILKVLEAQYTVPESIDKAQRYESQAPEFDSEGGRSIILNEIEHLMGDPIKSPSAYICDIKTPAAKLTAAGTVGNFRVFDRKPKASDKYIKKYFKWQLADPTGSIECVIFPRSKASQARLEELSNGDTIVTSGEVKPDEFRGEGRLSYIVSSVSRCNMPSTDSFVPNVLRRKAPPDYLYVRPKKFVQTEQVKMIKDNYACASKQASDIQYVVFDLETTGLHPNKDKIIEIGAVKIVGGNIVESFETLINPFEPLAPKITEITGIRDEDLRGQLSIEQALPDFYRFCEGATLVAHNLHDFDMQFVVRAGNGMHFVFDNPKLDTLQLARQKLPKLPKHNLGALAAHFELVNNNAHRALSDAIVTAKILLRLI